MPHSLPACLFLRCPCCTGVHKRLSLKGVAGFAVCPSERPLVAAYVSGRSWMCCVSQCCGVHPRGSLPRVVLALPRRV